MKFLGYCLAAGLLVFLYVHHLEADNIGGLFGVFWDDEGAYLLSAKNQVLFGAAHLFENDRWQPELIAPLLHWLGTLLITPEHPAFNIRLAMALSVLAGAAVLAWVAYKHFRNAERAILCFIIILLNPVLFFYARAGLSENLQFLLLALNMSILFQLYHAATARLAAIWTIAAGVGIASLFIAKISAAPVCVALGIGALGCLKDRIHLIALFLLTVALAIGGYFYFAVLDWNAWWQANIAVQTVQQTPHGLVEALKKFCGKFYAISYYFCLMPIFALYLATLAKGAEKKNFLFLLFVITVLTLIIESFFGGDIRRNFFGIALLSIFAGFSFGDSKMKSKIGLGVLGMHLIGAAALCYTAFMNSDALYLMLAALFIAIGILAIVAHQTLLAGLLAITALVPMGYQAFLAPSSWQNMNQEIETLLPKDAVLAGAIAPWYLLNTHRRIVLTNCGTLTNYSNDFDHLPFSHNVYFISSVPDGNDVCWPKSFAHSKKIGSAAFFYPKNLGAWQANSNDWSYKTVLTVYAP